MSGYPPDKPSDDPDDAPEPDRDRSDEDELSDQGPAGGTSDTTDATGDGVTIEDDGLVRWFLKSDDGNAVFARDVLSSVAIVAVIGLLLFGLSGVWPPLVAVESGSMEPNMQRGDLIFVVDDDRFVGDAPAGDTGVVTLEDGQDTDHERLGAAGDVIVFQPNGNERQTPVIHRAHFWVEEGENWVETKADEDVIGDTSCEQLQTCPAPHDGFVTKGDANSDYDQAGNGISNVVRPEWINGKAMYRIPWLGHVRLTFDTIFGATLAPAPVIDAGPVPSAVEPTAASTAGSGGSAAGIAASGIAAGGVGVGIAIAGYRYRY